MEGVSESTTEAERRNRMWLRCFVLGRYVEDWPGSGLGLGVLDGLLLNHEPEIISEEAKELMHTMVTSKNMAPENKPS